MPPRGEEELDPVTLHNVALINMDEDANSGFEKLQFLLQQNPCPPETFGNLLLLYCKYEHYDLAADVMAENFDLTYKLLSQYVYDYLDATITQQTSPEEGFRKFDAMSNAHTEQLRKLTKQVQQARQQQDDEEVKRTVNEYDEALERYIPVLMAQAKIYWDLKNYAQVEKIFRKSVEFCNEHDVWKLNVAHVLFMQSVKAQMGGQEAKYKEATGFYEPIVKKNYDAILEVSAIVLANLCVSYIMTSQNEQAEELMRKIEKEEENIAYEEPDRKVYHLCIVNLVIGTLYCAKGPRPRLAVWSPWCTAAPTPPLPLRFLPSALNLPCIQPSLARSAPAGKLHPADRAVPWGCRQLPIWHLARHQEPGTLQQETRHADVSRRCL